MKARAPPPPQLPQPAPRHIFRSTAPDGGGTSGMDIKENVPRPTVDFQLTLPQGYQTSLTEEGSKALMDLLVELCSRYHLNPALHTLDLLSPEGHTVGFKPNALLGSLNIACVLIKEKVWEEKVVRRPAPKVPEKTVRLMVNYHGGQKAVVRVNPLAPLQALIPLICDKCEFDPAHVLLLKDNVSRHELQLDKSLTELEIKQLYVHNQALVLQPKMASAPVLNYSDSIRSSTTSLGRAEKKGFLGIFQFSRRKTTRETTSMDMDDCGDKAFQNSDSQSDLSSTTSRVPSPEYRPSTFGHSQSVMNIPRMSPKAETKKRRAPALPGAPNTTMAHASFEGYQMGLGSESQQRKRKAPAPPPTPASITAGPDNTSSSASPTPDSHAAETPTPVSCAKLTQSTTTSVTTVVTQTVKPVTLKRAVQPPPVSAAAQSPSSSNPSSSTSDSLAVQDSSSEHSHSLDDSDPDLDQTGSQCNSLTSSTVSESVLLQTATKCPSSRVEESEMSSTMAAKLKQDTTSTSSSRSETESALNLKLDEAETNRHSAMGTMDRPAPPKPRRAPARESPLLVLPPTLPSPPIEPTESNSLHGSMEATPQSWLHSVPRSTAKGHKPETGTLEEETLSLGSSSGSSLPDQGYAASEGMGEDSGMVSSPSDTQPTSPDGSFSLDRGRGVGGEKLLGPVRDNSSDSDEGCATWGSRHRDNAISPTAKCGLKKSCGDEPQLTVQIHQSLADFEADLADHIDIVAKETPYTVSTDSNMVPVSVVDMGVPITAIDEVLDDYECKTAGKEAKPITRTESAGCKGPGFGHQSSVELQNKNNNACTAADSNKSNTANTKQLPQPEHHWKSVQKTSDGDKKEDKIKAQMKDTTTGGANGVIKNKQRTSSTVKSNVDVQKHNNITEIKPNRVENKAQRRDEKNPIPSSNSQRTMSTERDEAKHSIYQSNSSSNSLHGKITHNVTSRFGMKTFTVIPPKPAVLNAATGVQAVTVTPGAIKIDEQGNMVKMGISQNKAGGSSDLGTDYREVSPLLGKAKAFWSSNERQESVTQDKDLINKEKENTDGMRNTPIAISETALKTSNIEDLKIMQTSLIKRGQSKEMVKEEAKEYVKDIKVAMEQRVEVESRNPVSKPEQSNKPTPPPSILADLRKDVSFLKPSKRTSSQYVASAINKYTSKTSARPNFIPNIPDSSVPLKGHTIGFQRSGRSIQVNPHQFSHLFLSDNKENVSSFKTTTPGPKRTLSHPEHVSDSLRDTEEVRPDGGVFGSSVESIKGNPNTMETQKNNYKHTQSCGLTQISMGTNKDSENIKHIWHRSPNPAQSNPLQSSAKPPTAPKIVPQGQTSDTRDLTEAATRQIPNEKPQPSVTVVAGGVTSGPLPVTVFGPVQKFRPVICRSVDKETSLHSSLMEAIQAGRGRGRLKKIHTAAPRSMKEESCAEEENERSALLAAIRAQGSSGRLRKTKSEAAVELQKFKKVSEEESSAGPSSSPFSPSSTCTSPVFTPSPPPMIAPPPPLPVLPQVKPSTVLKASVKAPVDPALAREAMLEAICSGSAAERLKKVAVPTKTVKVNGRLGTIQATASTLPRE